MRRVARNTLRKIACEAGSSAISCNAVKPKSPHLLMTLAVKTTTAAHSCEHCATDGQRGPSPLLSPGPMLGCPGFRRVHVKIRCLLPTNESPPKSESTPNRRVATMQPVCRHQPVGRRKNIDRTRSF